MHAQGGATSEVALEAGDLKFISHRLKIPPQVGIDGDASFKDDLFGLVQRAGREASLGPDGVHFTPAGSEMLGKAVAAFIRDRLQL